MFRALRVIAVLHMLSLVLQPILAGLFLSGHDNVIDMHAANGTVVVVLGLLLSITAFLCWRRKLVARQIFTQALVIWVLEIVQLGAGNSHSMWLHIPLGTLLLAGTAVLMTRVMGPQPAPAAASNPGAATATPSVGAEATE